MKEFIFDKITKILSMLVKISDFLRLWNAVQICPMAVYKKELIFDIVTNAFSMFVVRLHGAVQLGLMAVIKKEKNYFN